MRIDSGVALLADLLREMIRTGWQSKMGFLTVERTTTRFRDAAGGGSLFPERYMSLLSVYS